MKTYDARKGRLVSCGVYNEKTKEFTRKVTDRHFVRMFEGYGMQVDVFDKLWAQGCERIVFKIGDNRLTSDINDWKLFGVKHNLGHGVQVFLGVSRMVRGG